MPVPGRYHPSELLCIIKQVLKNTQQNFTPVEAVKDLHQNEEAVYFKSDTGLLIFSPVSDDSPDATNNTPQTMRTLANALDQINAKDKEAAHSIIIPLAEQQPLLYAIPTAHWVTLHIDLKGHRATLVDSRFSFIYTHYNCGNIKEALKSLEIYDLAVTYQGTQYDFTNCGAWTARNIKTLTEGKGITAPEIRAPEISTWDVVAAGEALYKAANEEPAPGIEQEDFTLIVADDFNQEKKDFFPIKLDDSNEEDDFVAIDHRLPGKKDSSQNAQTQRRPKREGANATPPLSSLMQDAVETAQALYKQRLTAAHNEPENIEQGNFTVIELNDSTEESSQPLPRPEIMEGNNITPLHSLTQDAVETAQALYEQHSIAASEELASIKQGNFTETERPDSTESPQLSPRSEMKGNDITSLNSSTQGVVEGDQALHKQPLSAADKEPESTEHDNLTIIELNDLAEESIQPTPRPEIMEGNNITPLHSSTHGVAKAHQALYERPLTLADNKPASIKQGNFTDIELDDPTKSTQPPPKPNWFIRFFRRCINFFITGFHKLFRTVPTSEPMPSSSTSSSSSWGRIKTQVGSPSPTSSSGRPNSTKVGNSVPPTNSITSSTNINGAESAIPSPRGGRP